MPAHVACVVCILIMFAFSMFCVYVCVQYTCMSSSLCILFSLCTTLTLLLKQVHYDGTWRGHWQRESPISHLHIQLYPPKIALPLQSAQALQPFVLSSVTIKHSARTAVPCLWFTTPHTYVRRYTHTFVVDCQQLVRQCKHVCQGRNMADATDYHCIHLFASLFPRN